MSRHLVSRLFCYLDLWLSNCRGRPAQGVGAIATPGRKEQLMPPLIHVRPSLLERNRPAGQELQRLRLVHRVPPSTGGTEGLRADLLVLLAALALLVVLAATVLVIADHL